MKMNEMSRISRRIFLAFSLLTAGMAYEALNHAGGMDPEPNLLVVLNDNEQVSLPTGQPSAGGVVPAGALSGYTSRLLTSSAFRSFRDLAKGLNSFMPSDLQVSGGDSLPALHFLVGYES